MAARGQRKPPRPIGNLADPDGMGRAVADHLAWRQTKGQTELTVLNARQLLGYFVGWCEERDITRPVDVARSTIERYQKCLCAYRQPKSDRPLSFTSQSKRVGVVVELFRWLSRCNRILVHPGADIELPKVEKRLPDVLTVAEVERILGVIDVTTALGVRDRAVLETLYSTGMRRMEICALGLHDVDLEGGIVKVRQGKGSKDRVIPIGARAVAWIEKYIAEVRPCLVADPQERALFITMYGAPFSKGHVSTTARAYKLLAGVEKKGSCHIFRHTAATQMLENGADTRYVQALLGHEALQTTQIYTKVAIRKLKEVHTATHPSAKLGRRGATAAAATSADSEDDATPPAPHAPMSPGQATRWLRRYRAATGGEGV
jgi:integrase/recombinase XerD